MEDEGRRRQPRSTAYEKGRAGPDLVDEEKQKGTRFREQRRGQKGTRSREVRRGQKGTRSRPVRRVQNGTKSREARRGRRLLGSGRRGEVEGP